MDVPPPGPATPAAIQTHPVEVSERYAAVSTEADEAFDDLARLAQHACEVPIALVSLIVGDRQWFKARIGTDLVSIPREISFCDHAIRDLSGVTRVGDARTDPRFIDNPLVTGTPHVRFYAGAPILDAAGDPVGTVCVVDDQPRQLTGAQAAALQAIARQARFLLDLRLFLDEQQSVLARQISVTSELLDVQQYLRAENDILRQQAQRDPLTGLLNRAGLEALRNDAVFANQYMDAPYSVMLIDIDHFKRINDHHGHMKGDEALCEVAGAIERNIRRTDLAARFGGEEFLVVLAGTSVTEAATIAERIRESVASLHQPMPLTASIGLAQSLGRLESITRPIERADSALYRAKQRGRDRIEIDTLLPQAPA